VSSTTEPHAGAPREHYSYSHYASRDVAEGFDALRFGGPIGGYLLECQHALLQEALEPARDRTILDVGTGTGRAAIGLAEAGARVIGVDASVEMLRVARAKAANARVALRLGIADAHALPFRDRSADAVVCLRLLMHAPDWRVCVGELCRVARWRVVVDFPAKASVAAVESGARRLAGAMGRRVETYRVMAERDVAETFRQHGFRVVMVRRQFVLPIAFHKAIGSLGFTRTVERGLTSLGLSRMLGSPVTLVAER
jgi:ubiquinone/menaquinone biosynthesis C-methylase UbiE